MIKVSCDLAIVLSSLVVVMCGLLKPVGCLVELCCGSVVATDDVAVLRWVTEMPTDVLLDVDFVNPDLATNASAGMVVGLVDLIEVLYVFVDGLNKLVEVLSTSVVVLGVLAEVLSTSVVVLGVLVEVLSTSVVVLGVLAEVLNVCVDALRGLDEMSGSVERIATGVTVASELFCGFVEVLFGLVGVVPGFVEVLDSVSNAEDISVKVSTCFVEGLCGVAIVLTDLSWMMCTVVEELSCGVIGVVSGSVVCMWLVFSTELTVVCVCLVFSLELPVMCVCPVFSCVAEPFLLVSLGICINCFLSEALACLLSEALPCSMFACLDGRMSC